MAFFERDGDHFVPMGPTRGPWDPGAMNGGPVAMLVAHGVERHDGAGAARADDQLVARLTVDLVRPVPMAPLTLRTSTLKPGRRIQVVQVLVEAGGEVVSRGVGLRIPNASPELPATVEAPPPTGPDEIDALPRPGWIGDQEVFHEHGAELRMTAVEDGRRLIWARLRHDFLPGEPVSPAATAAAISDFPSGTTGYQADGWRSINADITTSLIRPPTGEWIALLARSQAWAGVGLAEAALYDTAGRVGSCLQSVLVEPWVRR